MDAEESNMRLEARAWSVGALLVGALAVYGAWNSARHNERRGETMPATEQAAPTSGAAPRTP